MIKALIKRMKSDQGFLASHTSALSNLYTSGVLELLRELGRVRQVPAGTPDFVAAQAACANWSAGFNEAIDCLIELRERFLTDEAPQAGTNVDFGALDRAIRMGDLTEEEANGLRTSSGTDTTSNKSQTYNR